MLTIISIIGFLFSVIIGFSSPRKAGWAIIMFAPLLTPAYFTLVPSIFIPLTMERVAFGVTFGILLSNYGKNSHPKMIFKSTYVKIVIVFSILLFMFSLRDNVYGVVVSYLPRVFYSLVLCYIIIKDENDFVRLIKIFVWQASIISIFIIIEYVSDFNIASVLARTSPNYNKYQIVSKEFVNMIRMGSYRAGGIDGHSVPTAYRLAFLFPFVLWNYVKANAKIYSGILILLIIISFIILQSRAAFVSIFSSLFIIITSYLFFVKIQKFTTRLKHILTVCITLLLVFLFLISASSTLKNITYNFVNLIAKPTIYGNDASTQTKIDRIPGAIKYFKKKPFTGYGSPNYAYTNVMNSDDLPSPFIYLLSGGIVFLFIYLLQIFYMPYSVYKFSKSKILTYEQKIFLIYVSAAFIAGTIVVFSNYSEKHFIIMNMIYISIYKIYFTKLKS